jgi:hypothetical protein
MDRYDRDPEVLRIVARLIGRKILATRIEENGGSAVVVLDLDDSYRIKIGVSGNLHDEAYLLLEREPL